MSTADSSLLQILVHYAEREYDSILADLRQREGREPTSLEMLSATYEATDRMLKRMADADSRVRGRSRWRRLLDRLH